MKTVLVTGGSRGIGKCIAENLAIDGYNVVLNYNKSENSSLLLESTLIVYILLAASSIIVS